MNTEKKKEFKIGDIIKSPYGDATIFDMSNLPTCWVRVHGYPYKSLSTFHNVDISEIQKLKQ